MKPIGFCDAAHALHGSVDWNFDGTIAVNPYQINLLDTTNPAGCQLRKDHDDFAKIGSGMATSLPSNPNWVTPFALTFGTRRFELEP